ncbi:MAG: phospho-N-acetylmuramoyl-pentapeptide-transferase, partial [Anaerolineales bacterium]|nr:phospho-N-acetylmuramoyl-pentapeptide-transferase [Anaerolineales bacterium]
MTNAASALALGGITFLLTVIWGGPLIRVMRRLKIGEQISIEGPQRHTMKLGTPTMGGWLFIIPVLLITGVLNLVSIASELNVFGNSILLPMLTLLLFALVGAWDDWLGIKRPRGVGGMRARWKFLLQGVIALGASLILKYGLKPPEMILPNYPEVIELG